MALTLCPQAQRPARAHDAVSNSASCWLETLEGTCAEFFAGWEWVENPQQCPNYQTTNVRL
jgi:hypothetical protein